MPPRRLRIPLEPPFRQAFESVRTRLGIPTGYPAEAERDAVTAARRGPEQPPGRVPGRRDHRDLPLLTVDPAGATDLDQAFGARRRGDGYEVWYAIADVAAFVRPGGPLDAETRQRGLTLYCPDLRVPLHPPALSEGAASLLPGRDRPALLWTLRLDAAGEVTDARLEPATVRSREQLSYDTAQERVDAGVDPALALLREIGELRLAAETRRGAVSLALPDQEVADAGEGHYRLVYRHTLPVERWNAQISLLAGMTAAGLMLDGGIGLLRTLPAPDDGTVAGLRRAAAALGVRWPAGASYAERVRSLDPDRPAEAALLHQAARLLRGAGYVAFDGERPEHATHAAIAADYAHVTAPLRRLCDRFANEVVVALVAGVEPPGWARAALPDLPDTMGASRQRESQLDRALVDVAEAIVLADRVGEVFEAVVVARDDRGARVQLLEPAVIADVEAVGAEPGEAVRLRLTAAVPEEAAVRFAVTAA